MCLHYYFNVIYKIISHKNQDVQTEFYNKNIYNKIIILNIFKNVKTHSEYVFQVLIFVYTFNYYFLAK